MSRKHSTPTSSSRPTRRTICSRPPRRSWSAPALRRRLKVRTCLQLDRAAIGAGLGLGTMRLL